MKKDIIFLLVTCLGLSTALWQVGPVRAQQPRPPRMLIPIGGDYSSLAGFADAVVARSTDKTIKILVLPFAYATDAYQISDVERKEALKSAEQRRQQIEAACKLAAGADRRCIVSLVPILTRPDAEGYDAQRILTDDLAAVFILGGDQEIAMQVIGNTPFEARLSEIYNQGTLVSGTSAGAAVQSSTMLGGYRTGFDNNNSLEFGAVEVWLPPERHGLPFGIPNAIIDQHFYQRGRFGRLLNAISLPETPHLGIGVDASTGVQAPDGARLENTFGAYTVSVLDAETYHAAEAVQYHGPRNTLSLRNVLVHLLAPGPFAYDLEHRRNSLAPAPDRIERDFEALKLPPGAGSLILTGGISNNLDGNPILNRFANLAGGQKANIQIIASGYPDEATAMSAAGAYKSALGVPAQLLLLNSGTTQPVSIPAGITGILLIGSDQSSIQTDVLQPVRAAWLSGIPVMADDAATAIAGQFYATHPLTPTDPTTAEVFAQQSFLRDNTSLSQGLGLLKANLEPRLIADNRWGRLFSLAYAHPDLLAIGLTDRGGIEVDANGAAVIGTEPAIALDLSHAKLALGSNQALVIANGLLDVFAPGEPLRPQTADRADAPARMATPGLAPEAASQPTATPSGGQAGAPATPLEATGRAIRTPHAPPTRTPRPTPVPPVEPPATDSRLLQIMIVAAIFAVMIVFIGVWINRKPENSQHNN